MNEDYEVVKSHGDTRLFRYKGIEDGWFVSVVLGTHETHLFMGSRDKAERTYAYYADGYKGGSRSFGEDVYQGELFN